MMTHRFVLTAALLASSIASADDSEVSGVDTTLGADPAKLFDTVVDAYYKSMSDTPICSAHGSCKATIVHKASFKGGVAQLEKTTGEYGDVYALLVGDGKGNWFAPAPLDDTWGHDCGAGRCFDTKITGMTAKLASGILWVTVNAQGRFYETDTHDKGGYTDYVWLYACQIGATPKCAAIKAGGRGLPGSVAIAGNHVKVEDMNGDRTVTLKF